MFFKVLLSKDFDHYCEKIDTHIKEDFETKVPDYGAEAFNPVGFHFVRRNKRIRGIYRIKHAKAAGNAFVSQSTHIHFAAKMCEDKDGSKILKVFTWPQLTQCLMLLLSFTFSLLFMKNFVDTYIYVCLFGLIFIYSVIETVKHTARVKKEFFEFFK